MPENTEVKRKRGRPRKVKPENKGVSNESVEKIIMNNNQSTTQMSQVDYERISLEKLQSKWQTVFGKYSTLLNSGWSGASNAGLDTMFANPAYFNRLNPFVQNQRVKSIISQGEKVDKTTIAKYMEDPIANEYNLQNASWSMYYQSMVYNTLIKIEREVPQFNYYVIPENIEKEDLTKESFKKERQKVNSIFRALKPKVTFKDITMQMSLEGKCFFVSRLSYDEKECSFWTFQKLPSKFCRIVGFGSQEHFVIMFDMSLFMSGIYDPAQYPPFIQDKWDEMLERGIISQEKEGYNFNPKAEIDPDDILELDGDTWCYWYRLPQNMAFTFSMDGSNPNVLPDMTPLLSDVVDLNDYKTLQQSLLAKGATAILAAEAKIKTESPVGTDPSYISPETLLGISDYITQRVGDTIVPAIFPVEDWQLLNIQDDVSPATTVVSNRIKDVVNSSNMGALISTTDKPSIITVKTARDLQEAKGRYIMKQFEDTVNKILNSSFDLKYRWKVSFWGGSFSSLDELKLMKELILSGVKGLLPRYLSAYDLTLEDYATMYNMAEADGIKIIKDELIYQVENNKKMQEESLQAGIEQTKISTSMKIKNSGNNETKKVGRPAKTADNIESDSTAASIEGGGNDSAVKDFSLNDKVKFEVTNNILDELGIDDAMISDMSSEELLEVIKEELDESSI